MRTVIQRVCSASVRVNGEEVGAIESGLLVFLGVASDDTEADVKWIAEKVIHLRVFEDADRKMNRTVQEIEGAILLISQFTLLGDCRKGRRPSFTQAAEPSKADHLYRMCGAILEESGIRVAYGIFGAMMQVALINDGPVTLLLDSRKGF